VGASIDLFLFRVLYLLALSLQFFLYLPLFLYSYL
jgi:hypothetical protein